MVDLIAGLNAEISRLVQARDLLAGTDTAASRGPGRPKASGTKPATQSNDTVPKKHTMSAEGKLRIAAAQKKRWAKQRKRDSAGSGEAVGKKPVQAKNSPKKKLAAKNPKRLRSSLEPASRVSAEIPKQPSKVAQSKKPARRASQAHTESEASPGL